MGRRDDEFIKCLGVEEAMAQGMRERGELRTSPMF